MMREDVERLQDIPNIGPVVAEVLQKLGINKPQDLIGKDPYALYDALCARTNKQFDMCLLDTFISAVRFMEGAPPKLWWHYTQERKETLKLRKGSPA